MSVAELDILYFSLNIRKSLLVEMVLVVNLDKDFTEMRKFLNLLILVLYFQKQKLLKK